MPDRAERRARELAKRRAKRRRVVAPRQRSVMPFVAAGLAVVVGIAAVVALGTNDKKKTPAAAPAPSSLVASVTSVPTATFDAVGAGSGTGTTAIDGELTKVDGKPLVLYVGAEYCPYCAAERWAMITALSRFGTFQGLSTTHSSSADVFPSTPTFTFHGTTFTSDVIAFQGVETAKNELSGGAYPPLDRLTAAQQNLLSTYDVAPLTSQPGAIPFVFIAGKYGLSGASYSPQLLQGMTHTEIAKALVDPSSAIAKAVLGTANKLSAAICQVTGNQPAAVCASSGVRAARP